MNIEIKEDKEKIKLETIQAKQEERKFYYKNYRTF